MSSDPTKRSGNWRETAELVGIVAIVLSLILVQIVMIPVMVTLIVMEMWMELMAHFLNKTSVEIYLAILVLLVK